MVGHQAVVEAEVVAAAEVTHQDQSGHHHLVQNRNQSLVRGQDHLVQNRGQSRVQRVVPVHHIQEAAHGLVHLIKIEQQMTRRKKEMFF